MAKKNWIGKAAASVKRRGTKGKCGPNCNRPGCTGRALALCRAFHTIARRRKKKQAGGPIATAGVDSGIDYDAMKYNEFFGPLQEELAILQEHGERTGNKKLAIASSLGQRDIGNYYETPLMKELFRKDIPDAKTVKGKLLKAGIKTKAGGRKLINMSSGMDSNTAADFAFPNSKLTKEQKMKVADKMLPYIQERLKEEYGIFSGAARPDEILRRMNKKNPQMFERPEMPIGGLISAGVGAIGAITNIVNQSKQNKLLEQQEFERQRLEEYARNREINMGQEMGNFGARNWFNPTVMYAQFGGEVGDVPVELELEENFMTPQGNVGQVDGPSHSQGGVPYDLPDGTIVLRHRPGRSGISWSKMAEPYIKGINRIKSRYS